MSQYEERFGLSVEGRVLEPREDRTGKYRISSEPYFVLQSEFMDIPCALRGKLKISYENKFDCSKRGNKLVITFKTEDEELVERATGEYFSHGYWVNEIYDEELLLEVKIHYGVITLSLGYFTVDDRDIIRRKRTLFGKRTLSTFTWSVKALGQSFLELPHPGGAYLKGTTVNEILDGLRKHARSSSHINNLLYHRSMLKFTTTDKTERLTRNVEVRGGRRGTIYTTLKEIGEKGFGRYVNKHQKREILTRGNEVLFGGGIPFVDLLTTRSIGNVAPVIVGDAINDKRRATRKYLLRCSDEGQEELLKRIDERNEIREHAIAIGLDPSIFGDDIEIPFIESYKILIPFADFMNSMLEHRIGTDLRISGTVVEYDSIKVSRMFGPGDFVFKVWWDELNNDAYPHSKYLIHKVEFDMDPNRQDNIITIFAYNIAELKHAIDRFPKGRNNRPFQDAPTLKDFTINYHVEHTLPLEAEMKDWVMSKLRTLDTNSAAEVSSDPLSGDVLIKINRYATSSTTSELIKNAGLDEHDENPHPTEALRGSPFAGNDYGLIFPLPQKKKIVAHHLDKEGEASVTGNQFWGKDDVVPDHQEGDILLRTKRKRSQALFNEDGDIVLEGRSLVLDAFAVSDVGRARNSRPTAGNPNEIHLGANATQKVARNMDSIEVNTATDPSNMLSLQMLCNMFGLPFSTPLKGLITGGSSKVKSE